MTDRELEQRLRAWYRSEVGEDEVASLLLRTAVVSIPRVIPRPARRFGRGRGVTLLAAAALLLVGGTVAAGSGVLRLPSIIPPVPAPSFGVVATASPPARAGVWIATGTMGTPRDSHTAVRLLDGTVLVAGGSGANQKSDLTSAELYDPGSGTWSATGNLLKPLEGFPATLLRDGKVLVGVNDPLGAEVYDPATGTWSATGKLVTTKGWGSGPTATLLRDGKVLVAGFNGAQLYDPDSGTWSTTGKMTTPRYGHSAMLLPNGKVLVAGGYVIPDRATDSAELYDPDTGSWTATANTPGGAVTATLLQDGRVLVTGRSPALYDSATGTWTSTGNMARPGTRYQTATLMSDGTVLVAGGGDREDAAEPPFTAAELYDPAAGSWIITGTMFRWHNSASTTPLLDGTVLVAGGINCSDGATGCPTGATGSAELYVPAGVSLPDLGPAAETLPTLRLPGTRASPAGEYGWEGGAGSSAGMHRVIGVGEGWREATAMGFAIGDDCLGASQDQLAVPVHVAGFDAKSVEPYKPPFMFSQVGDEVTRAYALAVGDRTLCVFLTWHPTTTDDEIDAAMHILDTIRAEPIGADRIRITFTLEDGWDIG